MKKVFIFLADGFEELEAIAPIDVLRRAGVETLTISISDNKIVMGSHKIPVVADQLFSETEFDGNSILVLPGGLAGMSNLKAHQGLKELLNNHYHSGGEIAAICASPSILGERGMLEGKNAICYPGFEKNLKGANLSEEVVVKDKNILTGKGAGVAIHFGLKIVEIVKGKQAADEIAAQIQFEQ